MLVWTTRLVLGLLGGLGGYHTVSSVFKSGFGGAAVLKAAVGYSWTAAALGALIGFFISPVVVSRCHRGMSRLVMILQKTPAHDIVAGALGLVAGLIIAILATSRLPREIPVVGEYLPIAVTVSLGYLGAAVAIKRRDDLLNLFNVFPRSGERSPYGRERTGRGSQRITPKILDTSVIIDGRISDICRSGFVEGTLLVPSFVLSELQHIADSSDVLKRNRGRRGLEILNKMQKDPGLVVQVYDKIGTEEIGNVDGRLVRLAKTLHGKVVTNDFNLNKVAELQGVPVLNINELANALKPIVLPGEEMVVHVIKDGKEQGQGVGYLDDGTMIVVDGGRRFIGDSVGVMVTSVLQTAAGRMIFAKPKAVERAL